LELIKRRLRQSRKKRITVVDPGDNEGMNEIGKGRLRKELLDLGNTPLGSGRMHSYRMTEFAQVSRQHFAVKRQVESQHNRPLEDYGQV
jgi:hypothetical protein